jgi:hypothetical protein
MIESSIITREFLAYNTSTSSIVLQIHPGLATGIHAGKRFENMRRATELELFFLRLIYPATYKVRLIYLFSASLHRGAG